MMFHPPRRFSRTPRMLAPAACALIVVVAGCASLSPKPDIDRAAATVQERSGYAADWTSPWSDRFEAWDGVAPLAADQAIVTALKNNRRIRADVESIASGRADLVQAGLLPNPVVSLTLRFPFDPVSGGSFVGAQAVQTLTALWLRDGKIKAADARLNSTVLDVSDKALRLVADVKGSHAKSLYGQRGVTITETSIHAAKQLVEKIEKQREAGAATQLAVNRARQQVITLEEELRRQRRELAKERRRLLELMGFASAADGWTAADAVAEDASDHEPTPPPAITEDVVIRLVATQRLDVAASRALVEASAADLNVEERNRLKDLGVGVDFERDVDGKKTIGPTLDVPIPIFDSNQAQIAKAGSLARAALATHEAILQKGIREARTAYIDATEAAIAADEFRHNTLGGREDLSQRLHFNEQNAGAAFQAGEITLIDWLDVLRERQSALQTLNDLRLDAALARIELEYAVGGRLEVPPTDSDAACPALATSDDAKVLWVGEQHKAVHDGDFGTKVRLADLDKQPHLFAIGPLAGLKGEITIIDDQAAVATAEGGAIQTGTSLDHGAAFLVYTHAATWKATPLPGSVRTVADLETYLPEAAKAAGVNIEAPFAFRIEGRAESLAYHVLNRPDDAPATFEAHEKSKVHARVAGVPVRMIGFYSTQHRGVFTPGDSDLHIHFVTGDGTVAGHVESFEISSGATLSFAIPPLGHGSKDTSPGR